MLKTDPGRSIRTKSCLAEVLSAAGGREGRGVVLVVKRVLVVTTLEARERGRP